MITARVFKAGNSKALRLPRALDVTAKSFEVTPTPDGFVIIDPVAKAKRVRALDRLTALSPLRDEWPRP